MPQAQWLEKTTPSPVRVDHRTTQLALAAGLCMQDVERFSALIIDRISVTEGKALCRASDAMRSLYAVRKGSFKTRVASVSGHEQITGFQFTGDMLGLEAISNGHYACDAVAMEDSEVCAINYERLETLIRTVPSLQRNLLRMLSRESVRHHRTLMLMGNMNAEERLAHFLVNLSERLSARGSPSASFVLRMRREDIGSYLGLRLETICRSIAQLKLRALVHICGREVTILNMEGLKRLTDPSIKPLH